MVFAGSLLIVRWNTGLDPRQERVIGLDAHLFLEEGCPRTCSPFSGDSFFMLLDSFEKDTIAMIPQADSWIAKTTVSEKVRT